MNLTNEGIKNIAEELEMGMKVYVNKKNMEIKTFLNFERMEFIDDEMWEEDINEIEENYDSYIKFENMDSRESYRVMEDFVETVEDNELRKKLELGLSLSRPFRNFKDIIDSGGEYRDKWFEFKNSKYIDFVKEQLEDYNKLND